jgi:hypothetical protein
MGRHRLPTQTNFGSADVNPLPWVAGLSIEDASVPSWAVQSNYI